MPEGDTIHRTARTLARALVGRRVARVLGSVTRVARAGLEGRVVTSVEAHGKNLVVRFNDGRALHTHMRMHGAWHVYRAGERWWRPEHEARVAIEVAPSAGAEALVAVCFAAPLVKLEDARDRRVARLARPRRRRARRVRRGGRDRAPARPARSRDRRGADGSACARGHRQRLQVRGPLRREGRPLRARRRSHRRDARVDRRARPRPHAQEPRHARARHHVGLRRVACRRLPPLGRAVPALRRERATRRAGRARHVLLPVVQIVGARAHTPTEAAR